MQKFGQSQSGGHVPEAGAGGTGQRSARIEDARFLSGRGRYVDDIVPEGALFALFLRAQVPHARLAPPDLTDARAMPGVHLVLAAADLRAAGIRPEMFQDLLETPDGAPCGKPVARPVLAEGRIRFVGEPVVAIVAETLAAARDAAETIALDTDDLPVKLDLAPGGPVLHDGIADNVGYDWSIGDSAAVARALDGAAHRIRLEVLHNRIIANALEPRGAYAEWDGARLHLAVNGQGVWQQKTNLCHALDLPEEAVRVTNPDVGGGFGMKAMDYPEYTVIAAAARMLGRPVRWMSERTEAMLTDNAGRDLVAVAELGFDADHRITGYQVEVLSNLGANNAQFGQMIQSELFSKVLTGVYHVPAAAMRARGIYTNTTQVDAYRGAGRPEAIYTLERVMDHAARVLGRDPWELRSRNFIQPAQFPYRTPTGELYDVGDFERVMRRAGAEADVAGFAARRAESAAAGRLRGLGLCTYIESILGDAFEDARITFDADGGVSLYVGTQSNGQGHETVYAAFLAERTGLPPSLIRVVQGDSDRIAKGGGTGGSRSVTVQTTATLATVAQMVAAFGTFLAGEHGVPAEAVDFAEGAFRIRGSNRVFGLIDAAELARQRGRADLLDHKATATLPGRSYPNGAHVAEVEVDPETGAVAVLRYTVTDDFGVLVHPALAEGQVHGGVAQGIGQALLEAARHDETGQLLSATFMDYAMPRATDMPRVDFSTEPVPSIMNPLGMKGCGEAGTVAAPAAVTNAVLDALWPRGVRRVDMPLTPLRVWEALQAAAAPPEPPAPHGAA